MATKQEMDEILVYQERLKFAQGELTNKIKEVFPVNTIVNYNKEGKEVKVRIILYKDDGIICVEEPNTGYLGDVHWKEIIPDNCRFSFKSLEDIKSRRKK